MIKLADNSIMLIGPDGIINAYESDNLQSKIIRSFMLAGVRDILLAEDITLAVEYALEQDSREDKVFAVSEINSTVIKILEDSGFPEAAESYRRGNPSTEITLNAETATVAGLIHRHLGLNGKSLDTLVARVMQAAAKLDISVASPAASAGGASTVPSLRGWNGTSRPVFSGTTTSSMPPTAEATTGAPQAMASTLIMPKGS